MAEKIQSKPNYRLISVLAFIMIIGQNLFLSMEDPLISLFIMMAIVVVAGVSEYMKHKDTWVILGDNHLEVNYSYMRNSSSKKSSELFNLKQKKYLIELSDIDKIELTKRLYQTGTPYTALAISTKTQDFMYTGTETADKTLIIGNFNELSPFVDFFKHHGIQVIYGKKSL